MTFIIALSVYRGDLHRPNHFLRLFGVPNGIKGNTGVTSNGLLEKPLPTRVSVYEISDIADVPCNYDQAAPCTCLPLVLGQIHCREGVVAHTTGWAPFKSSCIAIRRLLPLDIENGAFDFSIRTPCKPRRKPQPRTGPD